MTGVCSMAPPREDNKEDDEERLKLEGLRSVSVLAGEGGCSGVE